MAKANQPERSNAMRGESQIENLPRDLTDEDLDAGTITGQDIAGMGRATAGEDLDAAARTTATTKTRAAQERQTAATPTTMRGKKGNQPDANPPKR